MVMNREQVKRVNQEKGSDGFDMFIVAVKSSKQIPKTALVWTLTHVAQPGDHITLLVVVPSQSSGRKIWGFPIFAWECTSGNKKSPTAEQKFDITDSCSKMILQLHHIYDSNKIDVKIKIVSGSPCGSVAAEAKSSQANWVVLDKELKNEAKRCMEELQCNIVVMKRSQPKVLRLNLVGSSKRHRAEPGTSLLDQKEMREQQTKTESPNCMRVPAVTPSSSPESGTEFTATEAGTSPLSCSEPGTSPFFTLETNAELKKEEGIAESKQLENANSDSDNESLPASSFRFQPWIAERLGRYDDKSSHLGDTIMYSRCRAKVDCSGNNLREAISLSRNAPRGAPPLCSICQHRAPVFGKPPRWFSYAELELATDGFSDSNFLAEGGFGSVHRGVLPDGQVVAVKQHKLASSQGDVEFCSEVEVLSCAQHRNVVMLIGFCAEEGRRLLVYEYICNGSLDSHLYGRDQEPLEWSARQKIAVGAARGLRYLHEECRVGCIVHRDMRPNNILITHDFEPLVGDFGLARWQPDGETGVETRVIGTFGYLAPEYAQIGQITEKADVYSFGVVLVELVTGRKAVDLNRPKGQQCLTEWARPLLDEHAIAELVDPRLGNRYSEQEVCCMLHAASLCIRRDPHFRPRMSQVLRILEGDMFMDSSSMPAPTYEVASASASANRGGGIWTDQQQNQHPTDPQLDKAEEAFSVEMSLEASSGLANCEADMACRSCEDDTVV